MNTNYYNLNREDATAVESTSSSLTILPSIVMQIASGYIFDIFGRQMTVYYSLVFSGFIMIFFPLFAPNSYGFYMCRVIFSITSAPISNNPLVNDYVVKESRGAAVSFTMMGLSLGIIISLSVLF